MIHPDQLIANNTASKENSIWKGLNENVFRSTIDVLKRSSGDVPGDSRNYSLAEWEHRRSTHDTTWRNLSSQDEQRLADDLAYIAASKEGGKAVSAVALEECFDPPGLTVRLAANRSIPDQVPEQLNALLHLLHISERSCISLLSLTVVNLDRQRIHGRLRSKHWKPTDKYRGNGKEAPLHEDLLALLPKLHKNPGFKQYSENLQSLCKIYKEADRNFADQSEEDRMLQKVIQESFDFCTATGAFTKNASPCASVAGGEFGKVALQSKHVKQVEKIARYWEFCISITKAARRYPELFRNMRLELLRHYVPVIVPIPNTRETMKCYVHAEVQLVTFYGMTPKLEGLRPRVLGVSKSACYLCDLFMSIHDQFFISKTHGRLYDQWTVPNLAGFSTAQRQQYRMILQQMYRVCKSDILRSSKLNRLCPPESTHDFHAYGPSSPIAASTVTGNSSQVTIRGPAPSTQMQDSTVNHSVAAENNTEEDPTAVKVSAQMVPGPSPLPSISEIHEYPSIEETEIGERRHSIDRTTSITHENRVPSTPSSMSTIDGDTVALPLQAMATQRAPYHIVTQGMRILFEIEEPKRGNITISKASNELANTVDIDAMRPGGILNFYQEDGASPVHLSLYGKTQEPIYIDLEWLPD
ncbi:MAG: hypothetical protein Q9225_006968 [Loekoesia sp. 1 TL-2023]